MIAKIVVLGFALTLTLVTVAAVGAAENAPGGAYIQCDPHNPNSPVRCKPNEW